MSNRNCDEVSVKDTKQVKGPGYTDIAVAGEVMVTEKGNEGLITVYDRNLEYVQDISGKGKAPLRHLHPDCHGNLYVTTIDTMNILVLSKTGGILCSFGHDQRGETLMDPWMVHVCGHYVYCKIGTFGRLYVTSFSLTYF